MTHTYPTKRAAADHAGALFKAARRETLGMPNDERAHRILSMVFEQLGFPRCEATKIGNTILSSEHIRSIDAAQARATTVFLSRVVPVTIAYNLTP